MMKVPTQGKWLQPMSAAMTRFESNAKLCHINTYRAGLRYICSLISA